MVLDYKRIIQGAGLYKGSPLLLNTNQDQFISVLDNTRTRVSSVEGFRIV